MVVQGSSRRTAAMTPSGRPSASAAARSDASRLLFTHVAIPPKVVWRG